MKNISIESFSTLALTRAGPEYLSKTGTDGSILNGEQQTGTFMTVSSMAPRAVDSIPIYLSTAYCGRHGPGAHATVDVDSTLTGRGPMLRPMLLERDFREAPSGGDGVGRFLAISDLAPAAVV